MSISRSSNCSAYTDTLSILVDGNVSVKGLEDVCTVPIASFSCQKSAFEKPDQTTHDGMIELGKKELAKIPGCEGGEGVEYSLESKTSLIGAQDLEYSPEKLKKLGLTSNCYSAGNDPNSATHIGKAVCYPMEFMTNSKGERVKNTHMSIHSNLATCDISDEAMPQVQEDLRKVAAHNASENGFKVDKPEDLACYFSVLPYV